MEKISKYWSGPIPYEINRDNLFKGREKEIELFYKMVDTTNVSFLTGGSGVGKSSFLNAGIIPKLKEKRKDVPIYLVKNWGNDPIHNQEIVIGAIKNDIKDNAEKYEDVLSPLEDIGQNNFYLQLQTIAKKNSNKKVFLILDQFEEIIRASPENADHVMSVLKNLIRNVKEVHIVISFREEHFISFKKYESVFGGISNITLHLEEINRETCKTEIIEPICGEIADFERYMIDSNVVDSILKECTIKNTLSIEESTSSTTHQKIDLLSLQATMVALYTSAFDENHEKRKLLKEKEGFVWITEDFYKFFNDEKIKELGVDNEYDETVKKSLYIWFDNAITKSIAENQETVPFYNEDIVPCVFYFFVEICPLLASKGYKENWNVKDLEKRILSKYYAVSSWFEGNVEEKNENRESFSKICKEQNIFSNVLLKVFNQNILKESSLLDYKKVKDFVENISKNFLKKSFEIAINLLEKEKNLKRSQLFGQSICSIRHDKLGIVADLWAIRNKTTFRYVESHFKTTGALDIVFNDTTLKYALNNLEKKRKEYLRFRATYFFNLPKNEGAITGLCSSINFYHSIFTASVFEKVHFKDCMFINCN